tara:strand:+ start:3532 stop:4398 length:867 start_codon:yes stop_codon:yes gene_type:complete
MNNTAVIIFAFCREKSLQSLLKSIQDNDKFMQYPYYFFIDGPRDKSDEEKIAKVSKIVEDFSVPKKTIIKSKKNQGLANSIILGVNEVSRSYEQFIVLEDDLMLDKNFLDFMKGSLEHFKSDKKVVNISGFSNLILNETNNENYYLSKRSTSWGWASWSSKWSLVNFDNYKNASLKDYILLFLISPDLPFMLRNQFQNKINSWAIRLVLHQAQNKLFSVTPINSYVLNQGDDNFATNVDFIFQRKKRLTNKLSKFKKLSMPQPIVGLYKWFFDLYLYLRRLVLRLIAK